MDVRRTFEVKIVDGVLKAVCRLCDRAITKNIGTMSMHYVMRHCRSLPQTASAIRARHQRPQRIGKVHSYMLESRFHICRVDGRHLENRVCTRHGRSYWFLLQDPVEAYASTQLGEYVQAILTPNTGIRRKLERFNERDFVVLHAEGDDRCEAPNDIFHLRSSISDTPDRHTLRNGVAGSQRVGHGKVTRTPVMNY